MAARRCLAGSAAAAPVALVTLRLKWPGVVPQGDREAAGKPRRGGQRAGGDGATPANAEGEGGERRGAANPGHTAKRGLDGRVHQLTAVGDLRSLQRAETVNQARGSSAEPQEPVRRCAISRQELQVGARAGAQCAERVGARGGATNRNAQAFRRGVSAKCPPGGAGGGGACSSRISGERTPVPRRRRPSRARRLRATAARGWGRSPRCRRGSGGAARRAA